MGKNDNKNIDLGTEDNQPEELISKKTVEPTVTVVKSISRIPKVGLVNRTNYNLTVTFSSNKEEDSIILPPSYRSKKEFVKTNIKAINGNSLIEAQRKGLISIIN